MPSDKSDGASGHDGGATVESVESLLFDSLVHHLIEKGLLTKNDALSVVQTAAEVVRGRIGQGGSANDEAKASLTALQRTYASFEAMRDGQSRPGFDGHNVHRLRTPLHGDQPHFPSEDDQG